jgi:chromosome partitioning protein
LKRTISIANQKGGVGKTTTAINLSSYLANLGKKVLLIDLDAQGNTTTGFGINRNNLKGCIYDVLLNNANIEDIKIPSEIKGLDIVPSTINLAGAEVELVNIDDREYRLKEELKNINSNYDYVFIDCPPSLGLITVNALCASNEVIIPLQCEYYALEGLTSLLNTISSVQRRYNPNLKIKGILLTMYDSHTSLSYQVASEIINYFKEQVYKTIIPRNVRLSEAPSHGKPVCLYDPLCRGAEAYKNLALEIIKDE